MRKAAHEYVDLVLRTLPSGQCLTLRAEHDALEALGVRKHYASLQEHLVEEHGLRGLSYTARATSRRRGTPPKRATLIIELPPGSGQKTRTIGFQLGSKVTQFDLAEFAHFIEVDWHFLVGPDGSRKPRVWWEAVYQKGPHGSQRAA